MYLYSQIVFLVLAFALMLLHRFDVLNFKVAFLGFALSLMCVFLVACFVLFKLVFGSINQSGIVSFLSIVLGVLPIVGIVFIVGFKGLSAAPIHNVTTDIDNPPLFVKAKEKRQSGQNSLAPLAGEALALHKQHYSGLSSIKTSLNSREAFKHAVEIAQQLGWEIYNKQEVMGFFEAYEQTALFGFKDDIVVRVREDSKGAVVDLRSVSRVGKSDLGANAKRLQRFKDAFDQKSKVSENVNK